MKSELVISDSLKYEFDDEAEYQGRKFISFHKQQQFKENVKHQNLTIRLQDWAKVSSWIVEVCSGETKEESEVPF